jgi:hypothetical protein
MHISSTVSVIADNAQCCVNVDRRKLKPYRQNVSVNLYGEAGMEINFTLRGYEDVECSTTWVNCNLLRRRWRTLPQVIFCNLLQLWMCYRPILWIIYVQASSLDKSGPQFPIQCILQNSGSSFCVTAQRESTASFYLFIYSLFNDAVIT